MSNLTGLGNTFLFALEGALDSMRKELCCNGILERNWFLP